MAGSNEFDVVVLGAGPIGPNAAECARASALRWSSANSSEATLVGPGITELLHSATIAVAGQLPIDRLWHAVPCFPTISELWLRLLEAYRDSSADES